MPSLSWVLKLLSSKDQSLLVRRDAFLVLDLCFDIIDCVTRFDVKGDRLPRKRLDENLHAAAKTEDQVERRLFLNVVVRERSAVFELLSGKDQSLLVRRDAFLVL